MHPFSYTCGWMFLHLTFHNSKRVDPLNPINPSPTSFPPYFPSICAHQHFLWTVFCSVRKVDIVFDFLNISWSFMFSYFPSSSFHIFLLSRSVSLLTCLFVAWGLTFSLTFFVLNVSYAFTFSYFPFFFFHVINLWLLHKFSSQSDGFWWVFWFSISFYLLAELFTDEFCSSSWNWFFLSESDAWIEWYIGPGWQMQQ